MSRSPSSLAAPPVSILHLGGAEQAGEQPLLDGDVLDPVERDHPALALEQALLDDDLAVADPRR